MTDDVHAVMGEMKKGDLKKGDLKKGETHEGRCGDGVALPRSEDAMREILLEIRALIDATGHPCMMVHPEIVERLASERMLAREDRNDREGTLRRSA
ncbi:MAG: hypothetical protein QM516_12165 [Limnohabitans sp.]|jgi:hypothetical protein|nr:hypothetical protein [Limnohabitans sp.]